MKNKITKKNKKLIWFAVILLAVIAVYFVFHKSDKGDGDAYVVEKTQVSDKLTFAGVVDAERRADLGFAVGGRVIKNLKNEGDFVKKGELIAEVDQSAVRAGLVQSQANYELTKIDTHTDVENSALSFEELKKQQDTIVENLRQEYISGDLQAYLVGDDELLNQVKPPIVSGNYEGKDTGEYIINVYASSSSTKYSYEYSGLESGTSIAEVYQAGKLGKNGLYLQFDLNTQYNKTQWEIPVPNTRSATYLARKAAYEKALATREQVLSDAKNNINKLTKKEASTNLSLSSARIRSAKAQVSANALRLSDGKIKAPFDGYIVKNDLEVGETAQALVPQITMFASKKKKLVLNTPEIYINKINEGDAVDIVLDAYPDIHFSGRISDIDDIDTLVDGVPVYETEVLFDNEDNRLRVGMNAHASIVVKEKKNVLAIPKHFIHERDGKQFIWIRSDNGEGAYEQEVKTGLEGNDGLVEIISGLSKGQSVILRKQ